MSGVNWLNKTIFYQIFTGRWEKLNPHHSSLQDLISRDWQPLIDIGINTIYLLGLWEHQGPVIVNQEEGLILSESVLSAVEGVEPVEGSRIPSMMALTNHQVVDPTLGTLTDLQQLIHHFHQLNCKIIVDFIPNHTATTHPWVTDHPEYYQHQPNNEFIKEFSGDVYKLNYQNSQLRQEMIQVLQFINNLKVNGVRCDMAHLVPADFWQTAISIIKTQNPEFAFIAEAYPSSPSVASSEGGPHPFDYTNIHNLIHAGFDAVYDSQYYLNINQILLHQAPLEFLTNHLNYISSAFLKTNNHQLSTINYFSNHDDPPLDYRQPWGFNPPLTKGGRGGGKRNTNKLYHHYLESLIAITLFTPGIPFFYNGSLLGFDHRLAHHWHELLPIKFQETENLLPHTITKLFSIRKDLIHNQLPITDYHLPITHQQLITIRYPSNLITINLTPNPQTLSDLNPTSTGLIHHYQSSDQFLPGQCEIFPIRE